MKTRRLPGLIVHGPLITLMIDLVRRHKPNAIIRNFMFKAVRPTFDLMPLRVCGRPTPDGGAVESWAQDFDGWLTMSARAQLG